MKTRPLIPLCITPVKALALVFAGVCRNAGKHTHPHRIISLSLSLLLVDLPNPSRPTPTIQPVLSGKTLSKTHTAS